MSKARLVITALFVEGLRPAEVAERYGVHRAWVYKLKARYEAEGDTALEPRSRAPRTHPNATPAATVDLVLRIRKQLTDSGLDAGADTTAWHLRHRHDTVVGSATSGFEVATPTVVSVPTTRPSLATGDPKVAR